MTDPYAERLAEHGGMATCGGHLGVMVAPESKILNVPPGWVFVPLEDAAPEVVREALEHAKLGRSAWPQKET